MVPSSALGLHLHDREFHLCLNYWLGLRLQSREFGCYICIRGLIADPFGDHQVGDHIHRHDAHRDTLFSAAQSAALATRKEAPSLIPGSCSRPDVFLPTWCGGRPAALDVSVINPSPYLELQQPGICSEDS